MNPSAHASQSLFWSQLFSGPTPPESLGLALKADIVPQSLVDEYGKEWLEAWLSSFSERMTAERNPRHRPWHRAQQAGTYSRWQLTPEEMAPRRKDLGSEDPDAGLVSVLEGFHARGLDLCLPLKTLKDLGGDVVGACVALNLPAGIDFLATLPDNVRPRAEDLNGRSTPFPVHKERIELPWLHAAALGWQDGLLESLLDYGLDPNTRDRKGQTALFYARSPAAVRALLEAGADPTLEDHQKKTAPMAWDLAREDTFIARIKSKDLQDTLAKAGVKVALDSSKAVLHVAKGPHISNGVEEWAGKLPDTGRPLHEARLDPGGAWRGEWSPASWLGLQVLRDEVGPYHHHIPYLLERDDFLSPVDYSPRAKMSERGLLGLALAYLSADPRLPYADPRNGLHQKIWARLGKEWFWSKQWQEPIQATSAYLLGLKSTPESIRLAINRAWMSEIGRLDDTKDPSLPARTAWDLRLKGAVRLDTGDLWGQLSWNLPAQDLPFYCLMQLADAREKGRRESRGDDPDSFSVVYGGEGGGAWRGLEGHFSRGGEMSFKDCPGAVRKTVNEVIEWLIEGEVDFSKHTPLLEAGMNEALPKAGANAKGPKAKGRL